MDDIKLLWNHYFGDVSQRQVHIGLSLGGSLMFVPGLSMVMSGNAVGGFLLLAGVLQATMAVLFMNMTEEEYSEKYSKSVDDQEA